MVGTSLEVLWGRVVMRIICLAERKTKVSFYCTAPRWDTSDAEYKAPFAENPKLLNVLPFEAWNRTEYSLACFTYCQKIRLSVVRLPCSFNLFFVVVVVVVFSPIRFQQTQICQRFFLLKPGVGQNSHPYVTFCKEYCLCKSSSNKHKPVKGAIFLSLKSLCKSFSNRHKPLKSAIF